MTTCMTQSARSPALGQEYGFCGKAVEGGNVVLPAAETASSSGKSPGARHRLWEAAFVTLAALCLVLVPSVQSLGLSVDASAAAAKAKQPVSGFDIDRDADALVRAEVASLLTAD